MTKSTTKTSRKTGKFSGAAKRSAGSEVLGKTKDGVYILKPKGKATHFTPKELRDAIASARAARRA